jgi:hypothetical protein
MGSYLEIWNGAVCERVPLPTDRTFTIGRHPSNDLTVPDKAVSRFHASLEPIGHGWRLSDMSSNGTIVNGTRIVGRQIAVSPDAEVGIGPISIVVRDTAAPPTEETIGHTADAPHVTDAERRVILALCRPLAQDGPVRQPASVIQMADELTTSIETVKFHLRNLYVKFHIPQAGTTRRALLADAVVRSGVVTLFDLRRR